MRTLRTRAFAFVGLFALVTLAAALSAPPAANGAGSAPVIVTNTPLPVTGTVASTQSGAWNVGISGTPSVNVANTPTVGLANGASVLIGNSATNPVPVREIGGTAQPLQIISSITMANGAAVGVTNLYTVPAGKMLVIEYADAACDQIPAGQVIVANFVAGIPGGGTSGAAVLPMSAPAPSGTQRVATVGQQVRLYVKEGESVGGGIVRNDGTGQTTCGLGFNGHLVDVP